MIEPFANNHQSMQIGDLVIENQTDKITIYGDIDLELTVLGHQQAQQLHELTGKILQAFDNQSTHIKDTIQSTDNNDQSDDNIDNPFL